MPIVTLQQAQHLGPSQLKDYAYNALDCTGTREVADVLLPRLQPHHQRIYAFERALQKPALSMSLRGVRVDVQKRNDMVAGLKREMRAVEKRISKMPLIVEKWDGVEKETGFCLQNGGKRHKWPRGMPDTPEKQCLLCGARRLTPSPFNANSSTQRAHFFYDIMGCEEEHDKKGAVTTGSDAIERIAKKNPQLKEVCDAITTIIDLAKQLGALSAPLSSTNRYPSSFNVGGGWTGRFSSSKSPYRQGGNMQNVAPRHRGVFIADPGMEFFYADYMQGESNLVAHLSGDERYIEAHALGDVHTYVTRYIWPELPWTGDLALDKRIAKQNPPWDLAEGHDYRFQCKRIQHGSNYGLTPFGIAMIAKIPLAQAKLAYERYFTEFDGIPAWHGYIRNRVVNMLPIVNPLGREIILFGRPWDKHTFRQGLAFQPQSGLADIMDIALYRIWEQLEEYKVWLLAQVHDAALGEYPRGELELVRQVLRLMQVPVPVTDIHGVTRTMTIGVEAAVGRNWGHISKENPYGIDEAPIAAYLREHPL